MMTRMLHLILNRVMERVVKFRGKTLSGKWVYGDLVHFTNTQGIDTSVIITAHQATAESDDYDYALCYARNEYKIVVPETVGQFTGLHDKNGKEIYEGDLVKQTWGSPHFVNGVLYDCFGRIGDIRYECDLIGVHTKNGLYRIVGSGISNTVIGNIHDNPNFSTNDND